MCTGLFIGICSASLSSNSLCCLLGGLSSHFVMSFLRPKVTAPRIIGKAEELRRDRVFPCWVFRLMRFPIEPIEMHKHVTIASSGMSSTARNMVSPCPCGLRCLGVKM